MNQIFHINSANIPTCDVKNITTPDATLTASYLYVTAETASLPPVANTLLHLNGKTNSPARLILDTNNDSNAFGSSIRGRRNRGTANNPQPLLHGDAILQLTGDGWDGAVLVQSVANVVLYAAENWTTSSHSSYIGFRTTPINGTSSAEQVRIGNDGNLYASHSIIALEGITGSLQGSASYAQTASYVIPTISTVSIVSAQTASLYQQSNTINNSIFGKYMLNDGVNYRAGNIVAIYTTSSIKLTETCTADIGDTTLITINAELSASTIKIIAINNGGTNFNIKCQFDTL